MWNSLVLLAQEKTGTGQPAPDPFSMLIPMVAVMFLLWLLILRPQQRRQEKERQAILSNLKKNDKVLTAGGIYGTVISVSDKEDEVVVKVDDSTRLRMTKGSITRNLTNEEAAKAPKEGGATS